MAQIVPLTNAPNQTMQVTLQVNGSSLTLNLILRYNEPGAFWVLQIFDQSGNLLISAVPFITGDWPAGNVLAPYEYMQIGEAFVVNQNGAASDNPTSQNLGTAFALLWDDNTS